MGASHRRLLLNVWKIIDLLIVSEVFVLAIAPVLDGGGKVSLAEFLAMRIKVENFLVFFGLLGVWHVVLVSFGVYGSQRMVSRREELARVFVAISAATLSLGLLSVLLRIQMVTPIYLLVFWLLTLAAIVASRLVLRFVLESFRRRGRNIRHVLIVGTNSRAVEFAQKLESRAESGYRVIGFVDDPWDGLAEFQKKPYRLVGDTEHLASLLRNTVVDDVVIGLPLRSYSYYEKASEVAALCELQGIVVTFLPGLFNLRRARPRTEEFGDNAMITLSTAYVDGWPMILKRVLDVTLSGLLLLALAPLFLVVAVLIKLTSEGSVFFTQERLGLNKRRFRIYKFRTMVADAERRQAALEHLNEQEGPVFKIKADPRITPIGRMLRNTSIDELPQLVNVFKGEMSLVGPRPLPVRDYEGFDQDWHRRRFSVRPGITCLWQISGRNSIGFDKWMELDVRYIDHWSLWLDFRILAGTVVAVLKGTGAA
jgi:exopolysaccharide biosynthesis polyprenyl glycosylphosphotransferase